MKKVIYWVFIITNLFLPLLEMISHVIFIIIASIKSYYIFRSAIVVISIQPVLLFWTFLVTGLNSLRFIEKSDEDHLVFYILWTLIFTPIYTLLMQSKLLPAFECLNKNVIHLFKLEYLKLVNIENCYRVQIFIELIGCSIPMCFVIVSS